MMSQNLFDHRCSQDDQSYVVQLMRPPETTVGGVSMNGGTMDWRSWKIRWKSHENRTKIPWTWMIIRRYIHRREAPFCSARRCWLRHSFIVGRDDHGVGLNGPQIFGAAGELFESRLHLRHVISRRSAAARRAVILAPDWKAMVMAPTDIQSFDGFNRGW